MWFGGVCYELFDYIDEYYLTPINDYEKSEIMKDWEEWCIAVAMEDENSYYARYKNKPPLDRILKLSDSKRKFRKKAIFFPGKIERGGIPIDYNVE